MNRSDSFLRGLLKTARWHRRLLAGLSAAAAVYFTLIALSPAPPPTIAVLAAARDLPGGAVPTAADLRTLRLPLAVVPSGVLHPGTDLAKRVLAAPVRSGEPLTDARFLSPASITPGSLAYPLRLDDAEIASLLHIGDRIDLYAATSSATDSAIRLAQAIAVVALPATRNSPAVGSSSGALVVIAAAPEVVARIAQATANSRITVALSPDTS
jgi:Flp pilus assembly protein CpaB